MDTGDLTTCPLCFEDYAEVGSRVPRGFPCLYTVCEECLIQLIKTNQVTCPHCREIHTAVKGVKSFPQNKFILNYLQTLISAKNPTTMDQKPYDTCMRHGEHLDKFCLKHSCKQPVCNKCAPTYHKEHVIVDLSTVIRKKKKSLNDMLWLKIQQLKEKKDELLKAKDELRKPTKESVEHLEQLKKEVAILIEKLSDQDKAIEEFIATNIGVIEETVSGLQQIKEKVKKSFNFYDIKINSDVFEEIRQSYDNKEQDTLQCEFFEANNIERGSWIADKLVRKTMVLNTDGITEMKHQMPLVNKIHLPKVTKESTIYRDYSYSHRLTALTDGTYVILQYGGPPGQGQVIQINSDGEELYSNTIDSCYVPLAEVDVEGVRCIVVCSKSEDRILNIYPLSGAAGYSHRSYTHIYYKVRALHRISASTLVLLNNNDVVCLDFSTFPPTVSGKIIELQGGTAAHDMCTADYQNQHLVFTASTDVVCAFNMETGARQWCFDGQLPGTDQVIRPGEITTDGSRYLFVVDDRDPEVLIFSLGGTYLGCLYQTENVFGLRISWCISRKALIVLDGKVVQMLQIE